MATEKTVVFRSSSMTGTNADKKAGGTSTITFYQYSGDLPPAGSTLKSATVYISDIRTYSGNNPGYTIGPYGSIALTYNTAIHSETCTVKNASKSLLNFSGGSITFTVTGGGSGNVLNLRENGYVTLTIRYYISTPSTGSLSTSSVNQNDYITLSVNPADDSFYHFVTWWRSADYQAIQELSPGTTSTTFQIPSNWPTGTAIAILSTTEDAAGEHVIGENNYSFTINVDPLTIKPTAGTLAVALVQSAYVPSAWGVYVKGLSTARLTLSGCSPGSGASYKEITFSCGSQSQTTQNTLSFTTGAITETGTVDCNASVTNNYGNKASATKKTITVHDYSSPSFSNVTAFRCLQNGTANDNGTYISVLATVVFSSVNSKNSLKTLQVQYKLSTASSWSTAATITSGTTAIIGGGAITGTGKYQIRVVAIDQIQNLQGSYSEKIATVMTSDHVMFFKDGGLNASFGMEGERDNAFEINGNWQIWHGGVRLDDALPVSRGGTGQKTAKAALYALINALSAITPATADRFPFLDSSGSTAGYVTLANLIKAIGFSSGILPLTKGGTGASTAAKARENLGITPTNIGAAASTHDHNAADISGVLDVSQVPFKVDHGTVSCTGVSWASVAYSTAFTSTPTVVVSFAQNASSSGINPLKTQNETRTGFQVCMAGSSGSGTRSVNWIAIGT